MDIPEQEKLAKESGTQSRGKRHWLNKRMPQKMLNQVYQILKKDEAAEPGQKLSDKDRLHYLNVAVRLARILGERDKAILKANKQSPFD
jgi:hypothetical protein